MVMNRAVRNRDKYLYVYSHDPSKPFKYPKLHIGNCPNLRLCPGSEFRDLGFRAESLGGGFGVLKGAKSKTKQPKP